MRLRELLAENTTSPVTLLLIRPNSTVERHDMLFTDYLKAHNLPNIGGLVDDGCIWANIQREYKALQVYWSRGMVSSRQINGLIDALIGAGVLAADRLDLNISGQNYSGKVGELKQLWQSDIRNQRELNRHKSRPSKQLQAAEQISVTILDNNLYGNKLSRVEWGEKSPILECHTLDVVSLAHRSSEYPGIYALHVGDPDFWFLKLVHDYGNADTAWEIEIDPAKGDVLVEDVQYAIKSDENGYNEEGYSAILLTTRRILREGKDFRYVRQLRNEREPDEDDDEYR